MSVTPIKKKEYYDCIDCSLSNMFEQFGEDYRKVFINSFGFEYLRKDEFLNSIIATSFVPVHEIIHDYTNLEYNIEFIESKDLENYLIERVRDNKFLGVNIDAFYLPWNKYYNALHREHNILAESYREEQGMLNVYDVYLIPGLQELDIESLKKGYSFSFYLTRKEVLSEQMCKALTEQLKTFMNETEEERENAIALFLQDIENLEYYDYDTNLIDSTDFVFSFAGFIWSRIKALDYVNLLREQSHYSNLTLIEETLQQNVALWRKLKNYVVKNIIIKRNVCARQILELKPELIHTEKKLVGYINNM